MNEKEKGKDGGYEELPHSTSELDTLLSFGWARWTEGMSSRILVSAGKCPNRTSFVARRITEGYLFAECIAIDTIQHDSLIEASSGPPTQLS